MVFSYEIWSDVPWRVLGDFKLSMPFWTEGGRVIPFWWPVSFLKTSKNLSGWIFLVSSVNLFIILWCGFFIKRIFGPLKLRQEKD